MECSGQPSSWQRYPLLLISLLTLCLISSATAHTAAGQILQPRDTSTSICDRYTSLHFSTDQNTAANQRLLITRLVNTFVVGSDNINYTFPTGSATLSSDVKCAGIAAPAMYNGTEVYLLPYFLPAYASTNDPVMGQATAKLFLNDGAAVPLTQGLPSVGTNSTQYNLLTHIYQYYGSLLGCSQQGGGLGSDFPAYLGRKSMYEVHRYMNLDKFQMDFFISQTLLSAQLLGFTPEDLAAFKQIQEVPFNTRCAPAYSFPSSNQAAADNNNSSASSLPSVCIAENCPLADNGAACAAYPNGGLGIAPAVVNETLAAVPDMSGSSNSSSSSTTSMSFPTSSGTGTTSATPSIQPSTGDASTVWIPTWKMGWIVELGLSLFVAIFF